MIVLAVIATLAALVFSFLVVGANSMRSSPGDFVGGPSLLLGWGLAAVFWLAWWVG